MTVRTNLSPASLCLASTDKILGLQCEAALPEALLTTVRTNLSPASHCLASTHKILGLQCEAG